MLSFFKKLSPARIIALGFLALILIGSILLMLPICIKDGIEVSYIYALYTSTSAVCVTGLITSDPGDTFTPIGQFIWRTWCHLSWCRCYYGYEQAS